MGEDELISRDTKIIHNPANSNVQPFSFLRPMSYLYIHIYRPMKRLQLQPHLKRLLGFGLAGVASDVLLWTAWSSEAGSSTSFNSAVGCVLNTLPP